MKDKISYQFHGDLDNHFFAYAVVKDTRFIACDAKSFIGARKEIIKKLADAKQKEGLPVPPDEEIEL